MNRRTFLKLMTAAAAGLALPTIPVMPVKATRVIRGGKIAIPAAGLVAEACPCCCGEPLSFTVTITGIGPDAIAKFRGKVNDARFDPSLNGSFALKDCTLMLPKDAPVKVGDVLRSIGPVTTTWECG